MGLQEAEAAVNLGRLIVSGVEDIKIDIPSSIRRYACSRQARGVINNIIHVPGWQIHVEEPETTARQMKLEIRAW